MFGSKIETVFNLNVNDQDNPEYNAKIINFELAN